MSCLSMCSEPILLVCSCRWYIVCIAEVLLRIMILLLSLAVPLPVKIKFGKTWGSLEPFNPNC